MNTNIVQKYDIRLERFRKTGKLEFFDPDNKIFENFKKKQLALMPK